MLKLLFNLLAYIWQLPQNIVGIVVRMFYKQTNSLLYKDKTVRVCKTFPGGISLGDTVIVRKFPYDKGTWNTVKHEWGHTRQSLYLGPVYLLVIGIPSLIWAACYQYDSSNPNGYYEFYTEKWADKLGGVER
jgi:hypothetical protein